MTLDEIAAELKRRHMGWTLDYRPRQGRYQADVRDVHGIEEGVISDDAVTALSGALQSYEERLKKEQAERELRGLDPLPLFGG